MPAISRVKGMIDTARMMNGIGRTTLITRLRTKKTTRLPSRLPGRVAYSSTPSRTPTMLAMTNETVTISRVSNSAREMRGSRASK
ncbi:hypothetical protein [Microbacterium sp. SORGH_AS_0888]|uniref:hypothetical protein n=1 Tax=Microbacterium sp. SORGH_AS_0888 TaxID=3041791 RepID=UPI00277FDB95|nr:hypothetical protein [Microbacterium sp. SORGH_AS_0888]MDQ1130512.1 hypothetical protein [Microbacterium sp. SORGH_AS_0888]